MIASLNVFRTFSRACAKVPAAAVALAIFSWPVIAMTGDNGRLCTSSSLLDELDRQDRFKLERMLKNASEIANSAAVLWKVESAGKTPSYLFGTVHVVDESIAALRPAVLDAISKSHIVALETAEISRAAMRYAMAQVGPLMVTTDRPLLKFLGEDEMTAVERVLFKAGYPKEMALGFRPWVVTLFLNDSDCQKSKHDGGLKSLDLLVSDEAKARDLKIIGLESMIEQYETMASVSDEAQAAWLKASIHLHNRVDDMAFTMAELYRFRRLGILFNLTRELAPEAGLDDATLGALNRDLVLSRNERMALRSAPLIEQGGAFIAVGALHLMGEDGLVARLKRQGLKVTAIE